MNPPSEHKNLCKATEPSSVLAQHPSPSNSPALAAFEIVFCMHSTYLQIPHSVMPCPLQAAGLGWSLQWQSQMLATWTVRVSVKPSGRMVKE